jgi:hypothetical protein
VDRQLRRAFPDPTGNAVDSRVTQIEIQASRERSRRRHSVDLGHPLAEVLVALKTTTPLIARLYQALRRLSHLQITKIIGFGLGRVIDDSLANGLYASTEPLGSLVRHAILIICRSLLIMKRCATSETKIYVQDSRYREEDRKVLEKHGITILCSGHGQHQGLAAVDTKTLVYIYDGFMDSVPIFSVITEICAPAGIIKAEPMYADERQQFGYDNGNRPIWSVRIQSPTTGLELDIPQLGRLVSE